MWPSRIGWNLYLAYHLRGQALWPFQPLEVVQAAQRRRIGAIVGHAFRSVPYYQEMTGRLGLSPNDFQTADDLARLPILERAQIQRDPEYFVSRDIPLEDCLELHSAGSSGTPVTVFHNPASVFQNAAHAERERSMITALVGRKAGYREMVFVPRESSAGAVQAYLQRKGFFPPGLRIQRRYVGLDETPERAVAALNAFKPHLVHGIGSSLGAVFAYLESSGRPFHRPRAISFSSDGMSDPTRCLIEGSFGIPVLGAYQAVEAFKIGFECRYSAAMHLNLDIYPLRVMDANCSTLPIGERGEVVVSNLVNRASVLLNYRLGDIAARVPGACPCGRSLPLLSLIEGRNDDWLELRSGRRVHAQTVHPLVKSEPIWKYQVIQAAHTEFQVLVVPSGSCDHERTRARIAERFVNEFGADTRVEVRFVERIDRGHNGKFRAIISRVSASAAAATSRNGHP